MTPTPGEIVAGARALLDQGRYADALRRLRGVEPTDRDCGPAVELAVRARFEQGRIREAAEFLRQAPQHLVPEPVAVRWRLWLAFTGLYGVSPTDGGHPWHTFLRAAEAASAVPDPLTRALAADLRGRGAAFRVGLGWDPPVGRRRAIELMERAVDEYLGAGDPREAGRARMRLAHTCRPRLYGDPPRARRELERAASDAAAHGYMAAEADARLTLAKIDWDEFLATCEPGADRAPWVQQFERVAARYRDAGHVFGDAKVEWAFASVLLKYGDPQGVALARAAPTPGGC